VKLSSSRAQYSKNHLFACSSGPPPLPSLKKNMQEEEHGTRNGQGSRFRTTIRDIQPETPTVRRFTLGSFELLKGTEKNFQFEAGQWVDCFVPDSDQVGGYSICSTPAQWRRDATVTLAVKSSDYPPTIWMTENAKVRYLVFFIFFLISNDGYQIGSQFELAVGGDFVLPNNLGHNLLFIAGGIGINPIISMVQHILETNEFAGKNERPERVTVLYSAKNCKEFAFKRELEQMREHEGVIEIFYFITQNGQHEDPTQTPNPRERVGRVGVEEIREALRSLAADGKTNDIEAFVCGPPQMIDSLQASLLSCGLPQQAIHHEKWW